MVWSFKAGEEEAEDYGLWRPHWMGGGIGSFGVDIMGTSI